MTTENSSADFGDAGEKTTDQCIGYRQYAMLRDGLYPIGHGIAAGRHTNAKRAACLRDRIPYEARYPDYQHTPPGPDDACGYYAMLRAEDFVTRGAFIRAEVSAYGKIQLYEAGWRAEYCDITAIRWPICMMTFCDRQALQVIDDGGNQFPFCLTCNSPQGQPMADYLAMLREQYNCEIKEEFHGDRTTCA